MPPCSGIARLADYKCPRITSDCDKANATANQDRGVDGRSTLACRLEKEAVAGFARGHTEGVVDQNITVRYLRIDGPGHLLYFRYSRIL